MAMMLPFTMFLYTMFLYTMLPASTDLSFQRWQIKRFLTCSSHWQDHPTGPDLEERYLGRRPKPEVEPENSFLINMKIHFNKRKNIRTVYQFQSPEVCQERLERLHLRTGRAKLLTQDPPRQTSGWSSRKKRCRDSLFITIWCSVSNNLDLADNK